MRKQQKLINPPLAPVPYRKHAKAIAARSLKVTLDGVTYPSMTMACNACGVTTTSVQSLRSAHKFSPEEAINHYR